MVINNKNNTIGGLIAETMSPKFNNKQLSYINYCS